MIAIIFFARLFDFFCIAVWLAKGRNYKVNIIRRVFGVDCLHFMEIVYSLGSQSKTSFRFSNILLVFGFSLGLDL